MKQDIDLVAVYGSLRKTMHNNSYLADSEYIGEFQSDPIYDMYSVAGAYPALITDGSTSINMEVYSISKNTLYNLNELEGYSHDSDPDNHYNRIIIDTPYGEAFLYIYNHGVSRLVKVESGDWVSFKNSVKLQNV